MAFFSSKNYKLLFIIILVLFIIFAGVRGADNPVKSTVFFVLNPALNIFHGFSQGFHGFFEFLGSIGKLKESNENLIKENLELDGKIAKFSDTEKENDILRKEIGLLPKDKFVLETADITAENSLDASGTILIDKGANRGIAEGMPVIVANGVLAGKVTRVWASSCEITLITAKDSAVNGEILESGAKGIVKGTYGLGLEMDMISQTELIKNGNTVITSGLGGQMPRGLFIGKLGDPNQSDDKLFQQASVFSSVDFDSLRVVSVIKKF